MVCSSIMHRTHIPLFNAVKILHDFCYTGPWLSNFWKRKTFIHSWRMVSGGHCSRIKLSLKPSGLTVTLPQLLLVIYQGPSRWYGKIPILLSTHGVSGRGDRPCHDPSFTSFSLMPIPTVPGVLKVSSSDKVVPPSVMSDERILSCILALRSRASRGPQGFIHTSTNVDTGY